MIYLAISLFAVSAVLGLAILIKWLTNKDASKGVIYSHGIVAAIGLVLLIVYALQNPGNFPKISIILFVVAALGGFYMFVRDLKKKTSPLAIAFTHALLAVGGFVALLFFVFS
jgi:FtsH-binding integral membrane protein